MRTNNTYSHLFKNSDRPFSISDPNSSTNLNTMANHKKNGKPASNSSKNSKSRGKNLSADTPQVLREIKSVAKKVDHLESRIKTIDAPVEQEAKAEFNVCYILAKAEAAKIPDAANFVSMLKKKFDINFFYIKHYTDMETKKFNSNNTPTVIIFDLVNSGVELDKKFRQKTCNGILELDFYVQLKAAVTKIVGFRNAASEAYPMSIINLAVLDRNESILARSPAYWMWVVCE